MRKIRIGELLYKFRNERGISSRILCEGVCDASLLTAFRNGKKNPNILLFNFFLQRMGVSIENFVLMVTSEEYEYYEWKEKTMQALEEQDWGLLEELLQEETIPKLKKYKNLQRQYYYYIKGILEVKKYGNYKKASDYLKLAAEQTIPNIFSITKDSILLGTTELHLLILYLYYGGMANTLDEESAKIFFVELEQYISDGFMEEHECVKVYPKLIVTWLSIAQNTLTIDKKIRLCEKAVHLLVSTKTMHDITSLLDIYTNLLLEKGDERFAFYKKQQEIFLQVFEQANEKTEFCPEILTGRTLKMFFIPEYLYSKRMSKGLTQAKLSEGICEPETYSRIERGKYPPKKKNLEALAKKLDIGWTYYRGELVTDKLSAYRLLKKEKLINVEEEWEKRLHVLQELENILDMEIVENYQYIEEAKNMIRYWLGQISAEEAYKRELELLLLTNEICEQYTYVVYYSQKELEIIAQMAKLLRKQQKYEEGIGLLEKILENRKKSPVDIKYQWNGYDFILRILAGLYFAVGRYEEALKITKDVYDVNIRTRDGGNLPEMLDAMADDLEHMGKQYCEEYKKLYRQTYYVAEFYGFSKIKIFAKKYYEENFEKDIVWY